MGATICWRGANALLGPVGVQSISEVSSSMVRRESPKMEGTVVVSAELVDELRLVLTEASGRFEERRKVGDERAAMGKAALGVCAPGVAGSVGVGVDGRGASTSLAW